MLKSVTQKLLGAIMLGSVVMPAEAQQAPAPTAEVGIIKLDDDMTLRRMIVRNANPKGTVLLLHGFPETLYAWKEIALALGDDYEVHAFDWPGYGQSSRPSADRFSYAPKDYAKVLTHYIEESGIDRSRLVIYATDIGALPALLAALDKPGIARKIIVGDFAPFDRPEYMHERLQRLKAKPSSDVAREQLNANRDDTLENAFKRGLPVESQFLLAQEFKDDMARGWDGELTSADAFYHYYSHFTRDQEYFEANLARLKTSVKVVWGADDFYIKKDMGVEFARRASAELTLLPGIGHYPHLQSPRKAIEEIRATLR